jgi:hypothetical protein
VSILSFAIGRGSSADCERNSTFTDAVLTFASHALQFKRRIGPEDCDK